MLKLSHFRKNTLKKKKERQGFLKRKESKKILSIEGLTPKLKKLQKKKWRENFNKYYQKKLLLKRRHELMDVNTPSDSETDLLRNDNDEEHEQRDVRNHDAIPKAKQRYDEANPIFHNSNKKIRRFLESFHTVIFVT